MATIIYIVFLSTFHLSFVPFVLLFAFGEYILLYIFSYSEYLISSKFELDETNYIYLAEDEAEYKKIRK